MNNYTSKTKRNECKNEGCTNKRQDGSSRCIKCARKDKVISEYMSSLGRKGGPAVLEKYGKEHFERMRLKSLETRRANKFNKQHDL